MRGTTITVVGTLLSIAALVAWYFVAPAAGAGWILFVAFIGALNLLNSINNGTLATIAGAVIAATAGLIWFLGQSLPDSGWVGFLGILAALGTFQSLNAQVSKDTRNARNNRNGR